MDSNGFYTIVDMKNLNVYLKCRDFSTSHQLRKEVTNKLNNLDGRPAESCVEKMRQSVVLYAANSVIRF